MIGDNNDLGVALTMMLPLIFYLHERYRQPYFKWPLQVLIGLTVLGDVFTYSRGALVAHGGHGSDVVAARAEQGQDRDPDRRGRGRACGNSRRLSGPTGCSRSRPIRRMHRPRAAFTCGIALGPLAQRQPAGRRRLSLVLRSGQGEQCSSRTAACAELNRPRAAHSIWFEMLGDHGFVGLAMFLAYPGDALSSTPAG